MRGVSSVALVLFALSAAPAAAVQINPIDGARISIDGTPAELLGVNMPSLLRPKCAKEEALARAANSLLLRLVNEAPVSVTTRGPNKQKTALFVTVVANGVDVRKTLFAAKLAQPWSGGDYIPNWCGDLDGPYVLRQ